VISDGRGGLIWTFASVALLEDANGLRSGSVIRTLESGLLDTNFITGPALRDTVACVTQPDGKLLVGAASLSDIASNGAPNYRVFRLLTNGAVDTSYSSPVFDGAPRYMTLQPDGRLLVGGPPLGPAGNGGITNTVRLNEDGSLDNSFHSPILLSLPGNGGVFAPPLVLTNGLIYIVGGFSNVNGFARSGIARLLSNGDVDTNFVPKDFTFSLFVRGVIAQDDGKVVIGGRFRRTGDPTYYCLLRLNADGALDSTFNLVTVNSIGMFRVRLLRQMAGGKLMAVGTTLAQFNADGTIDGSFTRYLFGDPFFGGTAGCSWFEPLKNGKVIVPIPTILQIGSNVVERSLAFSADGTLDSTFAPPLFQSESYPTGLRVQDDGKLLAWGLFDKVGTNSIRGLARFNANGSLDPTYSFNGFSNVISASPAVALPDNSLYAVLALGNDPVAYFTNSVVHILPGGVLDTNFMLPLDISYINSLGLFLQSERPLLWWNTEQDVVFADAFGSGFPFGRVQTDGSFDSSFVGLTNALGLVQRDGSGMIASVTVGSLQILTELSGSNLLAVITPNATNFQVVRLNPDGSIDPAFIGPVLPGQPPSPSTAVVNDPQMNFAYQISSVLPNQGPFRAAQELGDRSILVGGSFAKLGGVNVGALARLTTNGLVDPAFPGGSGAALAGHPERAARVDSIRLDPEGRIWITGNFDRFNGVTVKGIARLNSDGTVDTSFASQAHYFEYELFDASSSSLQFGPDGSAYLSGTYALANDSWPYALTRLVDYPSPTLLNPRYAPDSGFSCYADLVEGLTYRLQATTNFVMWDDLTNVPGAGAPVLVTDPGARLLTQRFYRLAWP
jgi:uncharacterized delta-60 repeat protein